MHHHAVGVFVRIVYTLHSILVFIVYIRTCSVLYTLCDADTISHIPGDQEHDINWSLPCLLVVTLSFCR